MTSVAHARQRNTVAGAMVLTMGPAAIGTFLVRRWLPALDWVQAWLLAITVVTFLTCGYDKLIAGTSATRVPEKVLLVLAFAGGTAGALLGMRLFHHKTSKKEFLERLGLIVAIQAVVIAGWYVFLRPH